VVLVVGSGVVAGIAFVATGVAVLVSVGVGDGAVLVSVGVGVVTAPVGVGVVAGGATGPGGGLMPILAVRKFNATRELSASCVIALIGTSVASGVKVLPPSTERRVRSRSGNAPESTCSL
jgi:hypothetical protein